jgi:putative ABC transport system permease protein
MSLPDTVRLAWQGVRTRPLRNALTALSLLIGVVTVVLVQGSSEVIATATVHRALLSGGPATTVTATLDGGPADATPSVRWRPALDRMVGGGEGGHAASVAAYGSVTLSTGGAPSDVELFAVSTNLRSIRPFEVLRGRWFSDGRYLAPEVVLNRAASAQLGAVTRGVSVTQGRSAQVAVRIQGVVDDGTDEATVYVRDLDATTLRGAGIEPASQGLLLTGGSEQDLRRHVTDFATVSGQRSLVTDVARTDSMAQYDDQLSTSRTLLLTIAGLCLVVGALGILNIGLATMRDRSEEWAIRRALGASRAEVLAMVLVESQVVALASAFLALGIAWFTVPWVLGQMSAVPVGPTPLPWRAAVVGVMASSTAALSGALAPAIRTSRTALSTLLR